MSFYICRMCYQRLGVNFWITGNEVQTLQTAEFWICHIVSVATEIFGFMQTTNWSCIEVKFRLPYFELNRRLLSSHGVHFIIFILSVVGLVAQVNNQAIS